MIKKSYLKEFKQIALDNNETLALDEVNNIMMAKNLYKRFNNIYIADRVYKEIKNKYEIISLFDKEEYKFNKKDIRITCLNNSYLGVVCTILIKYQIINSYEEILNYHNK